jgi:hypothetical protein
MAAPSVAMTTTWMDRPRSGAYATRSSTTPMPNISASAPT